MTVSIISRLWPLFLMKMNCLHCTREFPFEFCPYHNLHLMFKPDRMALSRHFLHYLFIHTYPSRCGLFAVKLYNFDSLNSYSSVEGNIKESMVIRGNFPTKYAEKIEDATAYKNILFIRGLY